MRLNLLVLAVSPVLFGTLAFAAFRSSRPSRVPMPASGSDPILELHDESLTTYKPASASSIQDLRPIHLHRGVNIEGSVREAPSFRMALNGNPFENYWATSARQGDVRLDTGAYAPMDTDIALPSEGIPWVVGRSYNSRQETAGGTHRDSNGPQGYNWFQNSQPEIVLYKVNGSGGADDDNDLLYLLYRADAFVEFKRVDISSGTSQTFKATNGAAGAVLYAAGTGSEPDTYTYTDQHGVEFTFFGFDGDSSPAGGQLWKIEDNASNVTFVGHATAGSTAISSGYDSGGRILTAYDASDRRFSYTYTSVDGKQRLTQVKAEIKSGADWASPGTVTMVAQVDYDYYTTAGAEAWGQSGDLKLVTITEPLTDPGIELVKNKHYRYWEGTYNAESNQGHDHAIQYILEFEGARRFDWAGDSSLDGDYLTAASGTLDSYAHAYFEYDSSHRVDEAKFNGACGCGSSGSAGSHKLTYEVNGSFSNSSGYDAALYHSRTIVEQPTYGGAASTDHEPFVTIYFDETGQVDAEVKSDGDPAVGSPDFWASRVKRGDFGRIQGIYTPEAIDGYIHGTGAVNWSSTNGLITSFARIGSGAVKGFVERSAHRKGNGGAEYYDQGASFAVAAIVIGDASVVRPVQSQLDVYTEEIVSGTSGMVTTTVSTAFYSGTLAVENRIFTNPAVSVSRNGSGISTGRSEHYRLDGRMDFAKAEDGVISYSASVDGKTALFIKDADTTKNGVGQVFDGVVIPSGFASSGSPLHWTSSYAYDDQGRRTTSTDNSGSKSLNYYSRLADHRPVAMRYPLYEELPWATFHGPVNYSVLNQEGKQEVAARVKVSGGSTASSLTAHLVESTSDPILAMTLGDVFQLDLTKYDDPGTMREATLSYHVVPSSGEGADGTNYDETTYTHDDRGQVIRTRDATGTITRTVFDGAGRRLSTRIGTNDNGEEKGELTGTNTMTKVSGDEYDGGSPNKNSLLTAISTFKESGGGGEVEATMTYDYKGRLLLEVAPDQPMRLHAYDNLGRETATALYEASAVVTPGTTDPAASGPQAGRLALTRKYYDEMGRLWKSSHHRIDQADGSDDDSIDTTYWHDSVGRQIKVDGPELSKTRYDRLGRATHQFVLARDDDTAYSEAGDVEGDIVLEESQYAFDADEGVMLLAVKIYRHHDDQGIGETTGALDANADGDRLKLSMADLSGRAQIVAYWYDQLDRKIEEVSFGTYGGADFSREAMTIPVRSDSARRISTTYDGEGRLSTVQGPRGIVTKYGYDAAGRKALEISNYDPAVNSGQPFGGAYNQATHWEYDNGLLKAIRAEGVAGQSDQVTSYVYGVGPSDSPGPSEISSAGLLREIHYPDKVSAGDVVRYAYDATGRMSWRQDQVGTIIERDTDQAGRVIHQRVSALGTEVDGEVRRISHEYDALGRKASITQFDAATVGTGVALDATGYEYDDWGNVSRLRIDRNSSLSLVGSGDSYDVTYAYEKATGGRNAVRLSSLGLPNGKFVNYEYSSATGCLDDSASRVTAVKRGALELASYSYLGRMTAVEVEYPQPGVHRRRFDPAGYSSLDRFNRIVNDQWTREVSGVAVDFYSMEVAYDRDSNVQSFDHAATTPSDDASFEYDGLSRLTEEEQGVFSGGGLSQVRYRKSWDLDHFGNWAGVSADLNGDGDWADLGEYDEIRSYNDANELGGRDLDGDGTEDVVFSYNAVGQLVGDGDGREFVYDAFGRLRRIETGAAVVVAEYRYNGLGYRIGEHLDVDEDADVDSLDPWFYSAYDHLWREVCFYRGDDVYPKVEYTYHAAAGSAAKPGDEVLQRRRDTSTLWGAEAGDGSYEEKLYFCSDYRSNVVALVGFRGGLYEGVAFKAYGGVDAVLCGDDDASGVVDAADLARVQNRIDGLPGWPYLVVADSNLDGVISVTDKQIISDEFVGFAIGEGQLSSDYVGNRRGYGGSPMDETGMWYSRLRYFDTELGSWLSRDVLGQVDGPSLYQLVRGNPLKYGDPTGAVAQESGRLSLGPGRTSSKRRCGGSISKFWSYPCFNYRPLAWHLYFEPDPEMNEGADGWDGFDPDGEYWPDFGNTTALYDDDIELLKEQCDGLADADGMAFLVSLHDDLNCPSGCYRQSSRGKLSRACHWALGEIGSYLEFYGSDAGLAGGSQFDVLDPESRRDWWRSLRQEFPVPEDGNVRMWCKYTRRYTAMCTSPGRGVAQSGRVDQGLKPEELELRSTDQ